MKLFFITSNRIGDAVLSTSLLAWYLEHFPNVKVTIACGALPAPLFQAVPNLEKLIILHKKSFARHWVSLWRDCVLNCWDHVIDLRGSALAFMLCAKKRSILRAEPKTRHRLYHLADLLKLDQPLDPELWLSEQAFKQAQQILPQNQAILGIGPTANWLSKEWSIEKFLETIQILTAETGLLPNAKVALFSAPQERGRALPLLDALGEQGIDCLGTLPLDVIAACLKQCALYIGNDSGLMHIASAVKTPTIGLFGPSPEAAYAPWGKHCIAVRGSVSYEEILKNSPFDPSSNLMTDLSVDRVINTVKTLLLQEKDCG